MVESHGLEYKKKLVGEAFNGASVICGKHSGVQARIKEEAKYASYIHCSANCLVDTVKLLLQVISQECNGERSLEAHGLLDLASCYTLQSVWRNKVFFLTCYRLCYLTLQKL